MANTGNNIIDRSSLSGLIPEDVTREIIQGAIAESAVLRMGRKLPNMTSKTQVLNVLDALPTAYFVNSEPATGNKAAKGDYKQTTSMAWDKKKIYAEEIAVIVPIPEAVLDDADYDIWGEVRSTFQGDPKQKVQDLLNSGKMTQSQFNQLQQMAQLFVNMISK